LIHRGFIADSSVVGYDGDRNVRDEERQVDQEPQPNEHIAGDRLLKALGIDPNKWTVGDRRIALIGIGIGLTIVIIAVGGYVFGWAWTGLTKPQQRTFWDWLSLLIVPIVLALGGYLFNRSESRRTKEDADQRAQDDALQAYLDHIGELLLDKDKPLRDSKEDDEVRTLARARTLTVLTRLDGNRKGSVLRFLYEARLINSDAVILELIGADLRGAIPPRPFLMRVHLRRAILSGAYLRGAILGSATLIEADLSGANLEGADLSMAFLTEADLSYAHLEEAEVGPSRVRVRGAFLSGANLFMANLSGAKLSGADLREADLRGVQGVTSEELEAQAKLAF
jgi:uncharacterized protein YjbI with pentapeptide repeats